jgi:hypothetical protein
MGMICYWYEIPTLDPEGKLNGNFSRAVFTGGLSVKYYARKFKMTITYAKEEPLRRVGDFMDCGIAGRLKIEHVIKSSDGFKIVLQAIRADATLRKEMANTSRKGLPWKWDMDVRIFEKGYLGIEPEMEPWERELAKPKPFSEKGQYSESNTCLRCSKDNERQAMWCVECGYRLR